MLAKRFVSGENLNIGKKSLRKNAGFTKKIGYSSWATEETYWKTKNGYFETSHNAEKIGRRDLLH